MANTCNIEVRVSHWKAGYIRHEKNTLVSPFSDIAGNMYLKPGDNSRPWGRKRVSDTNVASLTDIKLLADLKPADLSKVEAMCRWKHYGAQEQIIDRQSETRDLFFVITGKVRVVNFSLSGREITLDDIIHGGHFGELAALDGQPRSASVMALTDSYLASIAPDNFLDVVRTYPLVALRVMTHLAQIVRISTDRIMDLSTLGANNRVHAELLRQARGNMSDEFQATIKPNPVHGDIASRVSTTRETVARVMSDLARQGVVERRKDALVILDVESLQDMVEEVRGE
jgi:CRP/FNR family transcriptional regulator, cyclic AMP receptor protein